MKKEIVILGIILLVIGLFIWLSTNEVLTEVQNSQYSYDQDTYISSLQNIWDKTLPVEYLGFIIVIIGALLVFFALLIHAGKLKSSKL